MIEVAVKPGGDDRPESRKPDLATLRVLSHLQGWEGRCEWVDPTIVPSLRAMQDNGFTLRPVAIREVKNLVARKTASDWTAVQKEKLRQAQLFDEQKPLEKIPYDFRFIWKDADGDEHDSMILAWEVCQTWRQYRDRYDDPIREMRDKFLSDVCGPGRNVSFFMGNLAQRRSVFAVCGVFSPPREASERGVLWETGR